MDSAASAEGGRFRFRFTADSGVAYLLSARYRGGRPANFQGQIVLTSK